MSVKGQLYIKLKNYFVWFLLIGSVGSVLAFRLGYFLLLFFEVLSIITYFPFFLFSIFLFRYICLEINTAFILLVTMVIYFILCFLHKKGYTTYSYEREKNVVFLDFHKRLFLLLLGTTVFRIFPSVAIFYLLFVFEYNQFIVFVLPLFVWIFDIADCCIYAIYLMWRTNIAHIDHQIYRYYRVLDWVLDLIFEAPAFVIFCSFIGIPLWLVIYGIMNVIVTDILFKYNRKSVLFKFPLHASIAGALSYVFSLSPTVLFFAIIIINPYFEYIVHLKGRKNADLRDVFFSCVVVSMVFIPFYLLLF